MSVTALACAGWLAADVLAKTVAPPPPVDYLEYAIKNVVFSQRESRDFPGPYNEDLFKFFSEVLHALSPADPCRIVTLMKSAQVGGTVVANIFTLGTMALDPCDFLYVHPTDDNASRWSRLKLMPMLRGTTALSSQFPERSRSGGSSVLYKERRDGRGSIQISGANSPASLSMVSMPRQVQDDLAKWEMNDAGDPEGQADSRSEATEFAKIFKISTPLIAPGCRITKNYKAGTQEKFHVPCPHCDHMQPLEWENMRETITDNDPTTAHFTCTDCGCEIHEHHRADMVRAGKWVADNSDARDYHRSFYIWSAYSPLQSWVRIARKWLSAKGQPAAEQVFYNDTVGKAYDADGEALDWEALRTRGDATGHSRGVIPMGGIFLTMGVDVQIDRVEWQLVAWGRHGFRAVVDYGVINAVIAGATDPEATGHISEPWTRAALSKLIYREWPTVSGMKVTPDMVAIDGNAWTEDVWGWAKKHPVSKVIMVRGARTEAAPLLTRVAEYNPRTGKKRRYAKRFFTFNGGILKMALYRNTKKTDPQSPGFIAFPEGLGDDYYQGLTSERRVGKKMRSGYENFQWKKDPDIANEPLDTMIQAEVAAIKKGWRDMSPDQVDALEAERFGVPAEPQLDLEEVAAVPASATSQPDTSNGGSFAERLARSLPS